VKAAWGQPCFSSHIRVSPRATSGVKVAAEPRSISDNYTSQSSGLEDSAKQSSGVSTIIVPVPRSSDARPDPVRRVSNPRMTNADDDSWEVPTSDPDDDIDWNGASFSVNRDFPPRISFDQIPGGLSSEAWSPEDILKSTRALSRQSIEISAFKLELDDASAGALDDVLGAVSFASGATSLVLPAHGPLVVGASQFRGCDVVLDEPKASGRHVFFEVIGTGKDARATVTDMASTNGVYVNGSRLRPWTPAELQVGDEVTLGSKAFARFRLSPTTKTDMQVSCSNLHLEDVTVTATH
jgi:hypothetical protein